MTAYPAPENPHRLALTYRILRWLVWLFSPKYELRGTEHLVDGPCIIVGNHCQMNGPIAAELYTPGPHKTWCIAEMMTKGEVAAYAFNDFWSGKPARSRWFFRLLSRCIEPLALLIFTNAETIPAYRGGRAYKTFRQSMEALDEGRRVVIFPECYTERNNIIHEFQTAFVDLARLYYRKTGQAVTFVPMYLTPRLGVMQYGEGVVFDPEVSGNEERDRVCSELMARVTDMALGLPEHTVIPYPNIPPRNFPKSRPLVQAPPRALGEPLLVDSPGLERVTGSPERR